MPLPNTGADSLRITDANDVDVVSLALTGTLPGVQVTRLSGDNLQGVGRLRSRGDGSRLTWQAAGDDLHGCEVDVSEGGEFRICGDEANQFIITDIDAPRLLPSPVDTRVLLEDVHGNAVAPYDVSPADRISGASYSWSLRAHNMTNARIGNLRLWVESDVPSSEAFFEFSKNPLGGFAIYDSEENALHWHTIPIGTYREIFVRMTQNAGQPPRYKGLIRMHYSYSTIGA